MVLVSSEPQVCAQSCCEMLASAKPHVRYSRCEMFVLCSVCVVLCSSPPSILCVPKQRFFPEVSKVFQLLEQARNGKQREEQEDVC